MRKPQHLPMLDKSQKDKVLTTLRNGGSLEMAARNAGCGTRKLWHILSCDARFSSLADQARTKYEQTLLNKLFDDGGKHWRAAAWALERLFPDRYAARKPHTLTLAEFNAKIDQLMRIVGSELKSKEACERLHEKAQNLCDEVSFEVNGALEAILDQQRENDIKFLEYKE